ncbi:MAG: SDR family NAD(P)-dependent oxidoreductase, partial [Leptospiraceae bacterium]|nr:SDR family NAD(P)-dependent oxidoreductase [Leptospiraceae bacterium]
MKHKNEVIILTGATDGIGREGAFHLASMGYTLGIHGRNKTKLELLKNELVARTGNLDIYTFQADFSELSQVKEMGEQIKAKFPKIYCLINNAGTLEKVRRTNSLGLEITFTVNHLSPFLLTQILLDPLKFSSHARVVTVSSVAHRNGKIDFNDLQMEKSYSAYQAYANSKLANILFTFELSERLAAVSYTHL